MPEPIHRSRTEYTDPGPAINACFDEFDYGFNVVYKQRLEGIV